MAPPAMDRMALATAPLADADDAELLASRLTGVPAGCRAIQRRCESAWMRAARALVSSAERLVAMLRASARSDGGYFGGLAAKAAELPGVDTRTARHLQEAGRAADGAYDELADWLEREYLPRAASDPAVGLERYARALQEHLGLTADPAKLAAWGWEELGRLGQLDQQVARRLSEEFDIPPQLSVLRHELSPPRVGRRRLLPAPD